MDIHVEGAFADAVRLTAAGQEIVERQLIFAQNAAGLADADGRRGLLENGVAELRHVGGEERHGLVDKLPSLQLRVAELPGIECALAADVRHFRDAVKRQNVGPVKIEGVVLQSGGLRGVLHVEEEVGRLERACGIVHGLHIVHLTELEHQRHGLYRAVGVPSDTERRTRAGGDVAVAGTVDHAAGAVGLTDTP